MVCNLDDTDCSVISDAAFRLNMYTNSIKNEIDKNIEDYGKEYILVKSKTDRFNEVNKIREDLLKIADKCNCKR